GSIRLKFSMASVPWPARVPFRSICTAMYRRNDDGKPQIGTPALNASETRATFISAFSPRVVSYDFPTEEIRMRKGLIFAIPAVLVMLASGCARDRILAPAREPSSTDASYSPQFVLHSLDDPALPAPGREAEAATTQAGALLDRLQMTRRPGPGGATPSAIVFCKRLRPDAAVGRN